MAQAIGVKDLMAVGAHFGHHSHRWNPKMKPYIYTVKSGIHILDLGKTLPLFVGALNEIERVVSKGGRVLFVGTKRQASLAVKEQALRCGQYYINKRWLGGTLTNWKTIQEAIARLKDLEKSFEDDSFKRLTKKEQLFLRRDHEKLEGTLGGIKNMGGMPDIVFVIDTNKESIAIQEAQKLGIKVVAILDSNSSPDGIEFPVPGNDDALRAVEYYCYMAAEAVLRGIEREMSQRPITRSEKEGLEKPLKTHLPKEATSDPGEISSEKKAPTQSKRAPSKDTKPHDVKAEPLSVSDKKSATTEPTELADTASKKESAAKEPTTLSEPLKEKKNAIDQKTTPPPQDAGSNSHAKDTKKD